MKTIQIKTGLKVPQFRKFCGCEIIEIKANINEGITFIIKHPRKYARKRKVKIIF